MLKFTYTEYVLGNMTAIAYDGITSRDELLLQELVMLAKRFGVDTTAERLYGAMELALRLQCGYGVTDPVEMAIMSILAHPDYFPADPELYASIVDHQPELVAAHADLLAFWSTYVTHRYGQAALVAMLASLNGLLPQLGNEEEWQCLASPSSPATHPMVQHVVAVYNDLLAKLGFSPAMIVAHEAHLPEVGALRIAYHGDHYAVTGSTHAGGIIFESAH